MDYYDTAAAPPALESNQIRKRRLGPPRRRLGNIRRKKLQQQQNANRRISKADLEAMSHFYEKEGVYDYVDPLSINDIFISASSNIADDKYDLSTYEDYPNNNNNPSQNQSLTRRVANAIFNPTIFAIIAIPLIIGKGLIIFSHMDFDNDSMNNEPVFLVSEFSLRYPLKLGDKILYF